jgi:hypothetical protein
VEPDVWTNTSNNQYSLHFIILVVLAGGSISHCQNFHSHLLESYHKYTVCLCSSKQRTFQHVSPWPHPHNWSERFHRWICGLLQYNTYES